MQLQRIAFLAIASLAAVSTPAAASTILTPTDSRVVSDSTTTTALNTVDGGTASAFPVRGRGTKSEDDKQVVSFLQFDVSSLSVADVNNSGFSAIFRIDYETRLNAVNTFDVFVGRNAGGAWDSGGSNNPLHDWGFDDDDGGTSSPTVTAADGKLLISDVKNNGPVQNDITADVSSIVKDWVEGAASNWGFVLYYDSNQFQGVGLGNPELVTTVPEPSSVMLAALGFAAIFLFYRRRRQSQPS